MLGVDYGVEMLLPCVGAEEPLVAVAITLLGSRLQGAALVTVEVAPVVLALRRSRPGQLRWCGRKMSCFLR